jgi:ribosomal protein S18 acetylase RimI-like enzyme
MTFVIPDAPPPASAVATIRYLIRTDFPAVATVERAAHDWPLTVDELQRTCTNRRVIGRVATVPALPLGGPLSVRRTRAQPQLQPQHEAILGFTLFRRHGGDAIELLDLAVWPGCRRQGIGRVLLADLFARLATGPDQRSKLIVWCRESNLPAQLFFRACGLRATTIHRGRFSDTGEDGYRMVYHANANARD